MKNVREVTSYDNATIYAADEFNWIIKFDDGSIYTDKNPGDLSADVIAQAESDVKRCYGDLLEDEEAKRLADLMGEPLEYERVKISYRRYDPNTDTWDGEDPFVFGEGYTFADFLRDNDIPFEEDETTEQRYYILDEYWGERTGVIYEAFEEEPTNEDMTGDTWN